MAAADLGADLIGLNFYPKSPRYITPARAFEIVAALPGTVEPIALFVESPLHQINETLQSLPRINLVQWHGREMPTRTDRFRLLPAFPVRDAASLDFIRIYLENCRTRDEVPAGVLVDAHVPGLHGGTGQVAPWELLASFSIDAPLYLAGGLTPENVALAVLQVRPYAVDVASGVESSPGRKDVKKMRDFIQNTRQFDG